MENQDLLSYILKFDSSATIRPNSNRITISINKNSVSDVMLELRNNPRLCFDLLEDHTAIDWPASQEIELVYQLYSTKHGHNLTVTVKLPREEPIASSVSEIWAIAQFQEREVFDMFGVKYLNHPDLRRLFLDDSWSGYPLRKDYSDPHILERPQ